MKFRDLSKFLLLSMLSVMMFSSCVSMKKFKEVGDNYEKCKNERAVLDKQNIKLKDENAELSTLMKKLLQDTRQLKKDTETLRNDLYLTKETLKEVQNQYEALRMASNQTVLGNEKEISLLLADLQKNKEIQIQKEDDLKNMSKELADREKALNEVTKKFREKETRVLELEKILSAKDSVVDALRKSVNDALMGYIGKGLTVSMKNGKVYVSLDESLLFASASWEVGKEGVEALKKLGKVLKDNADINIMVEGHTDNVPFKGSGQVKDNWDLSVMRATAVAKIILDNSDIKPSRVIAAGRSEFIPLDKANSKDARSRNRRTEIILTPKLDELFKIIESN
jgi:chemotaxis protein MotB